MNFDNSSESILCQMIIKHERGCDDLNVVCYLWNTEQTKSNRIDMPNDNKTLKNKDTSTNYC